ncbi:MAG: ArsR family transcriptional regulator, arsenate/arsenite/antimonite-responsive transcriptional [Halanaerobiales bacterium]|nr:ArsR family transcriptional regulator, arsenate/arsenite/antimonite-responsive transcriptional [Halanaerobiales bacterium]
MELVDLIKALAHENRIRILNLLRQQELCVCELESIMGVNQSNASRHLNKLGQAKIIKYEKRAQWVYYQINESTLEKYPFIKELIEREFDKVRECQEDKERLLKYQESGLSCEELAESDLFA